MSNLNLLQNVYNSKSNFKKKIMWTPNFEELNVTVIFLWPNTAVYFFKYLVFGALWKVENCDSNCSGK